MRIKPRDAAKPVTLKLNADFAVCEKVCLPAKAHLELTLPSAAASPYAGAIDAAFSCCAARRCAEGFRRAQGVGADSWRLCLAHEDGPPRDLFVEAPEGWWLKVAPARADEGRDCFTLTVGDKPKDAALPIALRLTLTGGAGALETRMDAPAPR